MSLITCIVYSVDIFRKSLFYNGKVGFNCARLVLAQFETGRVAESKSCTHRRDTPNSARPCAGLGGDVLSPHGPSDGYTTYSPSSPIPFFK